MHDRATRQAVFEKSWNRTERGERMILAKPFCVAQLRIQKAKLLGCQNFAAWKLEDQMARTPEAAKRFLDDLVLPATANAAGEAEDIRKLMDAGDEVQPWDWAYYAKLVRKAKFDFDDAQVKPDFEINNVLENGVFYAANQLFGLTFKERKDIPVYQPEVRVFEVIDADGKSLARFYCDYFKRDNKNGGSMDDQPGRSIQAVGHSARDLQCGQFSQTCCRPAGAYQLYRCHNYVPRVSGRRAPRLICGLRIPSLSGTAVARDFVEFPSQFYEHWATYPAVFQNYAKHYETGSPMPAELAAKVLAVLKTFNQGYALTEVLAAAELDMQWHTQSADVQIESPDAFEKAALERTQLSINLLRAAAIPFQLFRSYFCRWICGGLLRVSMGGNA